MLNNGKYAVKLISLDEHFLTPEQRTIIPMLAVGESVSAIEFWHEPNGEMGVCVTDDGARQLAYFDQAGTIVGDWIV